MEKNGQLENQIRILNESVDNFSKDVKKSENLKRDAEVILHISFHATIIIIYCILL